MSWGFAEGALVVVGAMGLAVLLAAVTAAKPRLDEAELVSRARKVSAARGAASCAASLAVLAAAVVIHILRPSLQAVPFFLGPLAAAAVGLTVFAVMPAPILDGSVRRLADLEPRVLRRYSSSTQRITHCVIVGVAALVVLAAGALSKPSETGSWSCFLLYPAVCTGDGPLLFPGWLFAAPTLVLIAGLIVAIRLCTQRIMASPGSSWPELTAVDSAIRRNGVRLTLQIANTALLLTTALFLGLAAGVLMNAAQPETGLATTPATYAELAGAVLLGGSGITFVYSVVSAVLAVVRAFRIARVPASDIHEALAQ